MDMGNPLERSRPALEVVGKPQDQAIVRARRVLTARHYSKRTAESYRHWIERFLIFHNWADPLDLREQQVNAFLTELAVSKKIAESTQNQTVVALFRLAVGLILYGV
jgi:site-specific recombinase XerD